MTEHTPSADTGRDRLRKRPLLPDCIFLVGVAAFGVTIGWFIGWGQSETSLSSIIPAVLSVVGGVAGGILLRTQAAVSTQSAVRWLSVGGLAMIVFSLGIFFGSTFASNIRATTTHRDFIAAQEERRLRYFQDLEDCTQVEVGINDARDQLGLEPYTKAEVCPMLGIWPPDPGP